MFQKTITSGRFTLTATSIIAVAVWAIHAFLTQIPVDAAADTPLWGNVPLPLGHTLMSMSLALAACGFATFLAANLNDKFILLRVTSRTLSSLLLCLLTATASMHLIGSPHLILICCLLSYFPLFSSYQRGEHAVAPFLSALCLSLASLLHPHLVLLLPLLWIHLIQLRAFSARSFMATLMGLLVPWWMLFTAAVCTDSLPAFLTHASSALPTVLFHFEALTPDILPPLILTFAISAIGAIDYLNQRHLDKTRTRAIYNAVLLHSAILYLAIPILPADASILLPLLMADAAILGGHFIVLSHGRMQNIITILIALSLLALTIFQLLTTTF